MMFLVCDGVGGENAGEVASKTIIDCFWERIFQLEENRDTAFIEAWLRNQLQSIHEHMISIECLLVFLGF